MRQPDRLAQIIQLLRNGRRPMTSRALAQALGTSVRTVYRDIQELQAQHVPIEGEAGIGYVLGRGYGLPPLMLSANEIDAILLGLHWAQNRGDATLASAAYGLLAKIRDVVPAHLQPVVLEPVVTAGSAAPESMNAVDLDRLRASVRLQRKVRIVYECPSGTLSECVIWPIALAYSEALRVLAAWCERRQGFWHFRTDRITHTTILDEVYPIARTKLLEDWWNTSRV